jgi:hypothetical protein
MHFGGVIRLGSRASSNAAVYSLSGLYNCTLAAMTSCMTAVTLPLVACSESEQNSLEFVLIYKPDLAAEAVGGMTRSQFCRSHLE